MKPQQKKNNNKKNNNQHEICNIVKIISIDRSTAAPSCCCEKAPKEILYVHKHIYAPSNVYMY